MILHHQAGYWGIQSTRTSRIYMIRWLPSMNRWACECPDYVYRRAEKREDCKHIKMLKQFLDTAPIERLEELRQNGEITI